MIRHILLFSFKDDVAAEDRAALLAELALFPRRFALIRDWQMGANASDRDRTYEHGVTMTFADREGLTAYLGSDAHEAFVRDRFRPLVSTRAIVSFDTE